MAFANEMEAGNPDMIAYNNITKRWTSYSHTLHRTLHCGTKEDKDDMTKMAMLLYKSWKGGANLVILDCNESTDTLLLRS